MNRRFVFVFRLHPFRLALGVCTRPIRVWRAIGGWQFGIGAGFLINHRTYPCQCLYAWCGNPAWFLINRMEVLCDHHLRHAERRLRLPAEVSTTG